MIINSRSVGDPDRFPSLRHLEREFEKLAHSHREQGRVFLIVRRTEGGTREVLESIRVTREEGIPGDAWARTATPNPTMQIAVMQSDVATLIANGQPLTLFGDGLFLDLNLSSENLPVESRVAAGSAILEVTPMPHNGCRKFLARFGQDALSFVSNPEWRRFNLRGIYMRVAQEGEIRPGDSVTILRRGA
jgi:MOSC domain-containing protein YiiM